MNKKALSIIILVLALVGTAWYVVAKRNMTSVPAPELNTAVAEQVSKPGTTLRLIPSQQRISVGESFIMDVEISSGEKIAAVDVSIRFDPSSLELTDMSPGSFFTNAQPFSEKIDQGNGVAFYAIGSLDPKAGTGSIARLSFTGRQPGVSVIVELDDQTVVTSTDIEGSVSVELPVKSSIQIVPVPQ